MVQMEIAQKHLFKIMRRDSSTFDVSGVRNADNINKITFSTETISAVSGANRITYVRSNDANRKEGFDVGQQFWDICIRNGCC